MYSNVTAFREWIDITMDNNGGAEICPITTITETSDSEIAVPTSSCKCGVKKGRERIVGGDEATVSLQIINFLQESCKICNNQ